MSDRKHIVLVAVQQSLLGEIGPQLRAVTVTYNETSINLDSYFDGTITEADKESMSCVETELMALFPSQHTIVVRLHRLDHPASIPKDTTWVYYRREQLD
jgi:hypothetical protein